MEPNLVGYLGVSEFLSVHARLQTLNPGPDSAQVRTDWNLEILSALELVVELK